MKDAVSPPNTPVSDHTLPGGSYTSSALFLNLPKMLRPATEPHPHIPTPHFPSVILSMAPGGHSDPCLLSAVHGVWDEWSPWSLCSFTCGRGQRTRTRTCEPPLHGGRPCDGPETQTRLCNIALCPGRLPLHSPVAQILSQIVCVY